MTLAFDVLAEPHRRQILDLLRSGDRAVGDLTDAMTLSQPSVSKHLRVLYVGLVTVRADSQRRIYRLRLDPLMDVDSWLAPYRTIWNERLDALENHLDEMEDE